MSEQPRLTIYGRKNSINVMKVVWCAAELGVPYDRIDVGGPFAFENAPDYLSLNPNGRVPTIRDGDLVLWESNVIVRYLSETYGMGSLFPDSPAQRWDAERWMDWMQTTLNPQLSVILLQTVRTPPEQRNMNAVEAARKAAAEAWSILDAHLAERQFVTGDAFSMGDIPLGAAVYRWYAYDIERPPLPHLEAWHQRLLAREAYQQHVNQPLS